MEPMTLDQEWVLDVLEMVQDMRVNGGELDCALPYALLPSHQRDISRTVRDLRRFGYACQVWRDARHRITRVRLLEQ